MRRARVTSDRPVRFRAALAAALDKVKRRLRQFCVRLEQPGVYDDLALVAHHRSMLSMRQVPMTDVAREAIEKHVASEKKKYGL